MLLSGWHGHLFISNRWPSQHVRHEPQRLGPEWRLFSEGSCLISGVDSGVDEMWTPWGAAPVVAVDTTSGPRPRRRTSRPGNTSRGHATYRGRKNNRGVDLNQQRRTFTTAVASRSSKSVPRCRLGFSRCHTDTPLPGSSNGASELFYPPTGE